MTASLLLWNARVVTAAGCHEDGWLAVRAGRIAGIGSGSPPPEHADAAQAFDAAGALLLPGFIDPHVHGALGHETMDADVEGLAAMAEFSASHGVTAFLATTWTAGTRETLAALDTVKQAMSQVDRGARIIGAHMEGPYLNPRRCGAQDQALIRPADADEAARFLDTGVVRLITVAPEVGQNMALVEHCAGRGITVSAGHTDATYGEMVEAVSRGVRHITHTYNAMRPLHHREPGVVGAALTLSQVTAEVIADGVHVHPVAVRVLYEARGSDGIVLATDAMRATGMPPGDYTIGGRSVALRDDTVRLPDGALAGSVLTLDAGLRHLHRATGVPLAELWPTVSRNAARIAGVGHRKGSIAVGMDADLALVDEDAVVQLTVVEGRVAYRRAALDMIGIEHFAS